jgi:multiple sugar transport system substrate-binding protein
MDGGRTRRDFLRLAAGAAVVATGGACASDKRETRAKPRAGTESAGTLRIAQWSHFIPAYDTWFDSEYTQRWGEEHDVQVVVDHISLNELSSRAAAEVSAQRGHDLFALIAPAAAFEDEVIDHREIVEEVRAKVGPMTPFVERGVFNPKTGRYFGFPDFWTPYPAVYRTDLWSTVGHPSGPETWDDVLRAAPDLAAGGHPAAFSFSSEFDSSWTLESLMQAHGASIQDEDGNVTLGRTATMEAVKMGTALYRAGMPQEVFSWDTYSNNRSMVTGTGSFTLNPITVARAVEAQDPGLARRIAFAPVPAGPSERTGIGAGNTYVIWKFAQNQEAAKQFLVDLAVGYREVFLHSDYLNLPPFPGAVEDFPSLVTNDTRVQPPDRYALLAGAADWTTNVGHPGATNAAVDEVFNQYVIPKMFATAARGEVTPEEAVRVAEAQIKPIFQKWRDRGKV